MKHAVYFRAPGTDSWIKATKTFDDMTEAHRFAYVGIYEHKLGDAYRIEHEGPKPLNMRAFVREAVRVAEQCECAITPAEVQNARRIARQFLREFGSYPERFP